VVIVLFAVGIQEGERTARWLVPGGCFDPHVERTEPLTGAGPVRVVAERREELAVPRQSRQLNGSHRPAPGRFLEAVGGVDDLAGTRDVVHVGKFDPFDMSDYGCTHRRGFSRLRVSARAAM
jgi:hypothetical protein